QPGEAQVRRLLRSRLTFRHDLGGGEVIATAVARLHQQPTVDPPIVQPRGRGVERPGAEDADILLPGRPRRQHAEGGVAEAGGDDALDEAAWLGDLRRRRFVQLTVAAEHAAKSAEWVALIGLSERFLQRRADRRAAGIV